MNWHPYWVNSPAPQHTGHSVPRACPQCKLYNAGCDVQCTLMFACTSVHYTPLYTCTLHSFVHIYFCTLYSSVYFSHLYNCTLLYICTHVHCTSLYTGHLYTVLPYTHLNLYTVLPCTSVHCTPLYVQTRWAKTAPLAFCWSSMETCSGANKDQVSLFSGYYTAQNCIFFCIALFSLFIYLFFVLNKTALVCTAKKMHLF